MKYIATTIITLAVMILSFIIVLLIFSEKKIHYNRISTYDEVEVLGKLGGLYFNTYRVYTSQTGNVNVYDYRNTVLGNDFISVTTDEELFGFTLESKVSYYKTDFNAFIKYKESFQ